jgi:hypothetical protein
MSEEQIADAEKTGLDALQLTKAQYDQKLQLGLITKAEMIAMEQDLENQKLQILMAAQQARIAMVETDPNHSPVALQKEKDKLSRSSASTSRASRRCVRRRPWRTARTPRNSATTSRPVSPR